VGVSLPRKSIVQTKLAFRGILAPLSVALTAVSALAATGCLDSGSLFGTISNDASLTGRTAASGNFPGCTSANALDTGRIEIGFAFPDGATQMTILRSGIAIFTTTNKSQTSYIDTGLLEGQTYSYSCQALVNGQVSTGSTQPSVSTLVINAPTFAGISGVTVLSASSVRVSWNAPSGQGVPVSSYKIFANIGGSVVFTNSPVQTASVGAFSAVVTGLGDELTYSFAVRACSASGICDINTAQTNATLPDGGAPNTVGATAAVANNGAINITVPWVSSNGAVFKRFVYYSTAATTPALPTGAQTWTGQGYTLAFTSQNASAATTAPATTVSIAATDNTHYSIVVQDQDPAGNKVSTSNLNILTFDTGRLTPPTFSGLTSVQVGNPAGNLAANTPDTKVTLGFTAIAREGTADSGASQGTTNYILYATSTPFSYPTNSPAPTTSCTSGTPVATISAATFAPGAASYAVTGLLPRTNYNFCLKAQDSAGNFSVTTIDVTAPSFDGIQTVTFTNSTASINLGWNSSVSSDVDTYKITMWRNATTPPAACPGSGCSQKVVSASAYPSGGTFTTTDFVMFDNDDLYIVVDACDTASVLPGSAGNNCTSTTLSYPGTGVRKFTLPAFTPPPGFQGIASSGNTSTVTGQASVTVQTPWPPVGLTAGQIAQYAGFYVYEDDAPTNPSNPNPLTLLADCRCSAAGCGGAGDTTCAVTGLNAFKLYNFHMRAYDSAGNITLYVSPILSYASVRIADTVAPSLSAALTIDSVNAPYPIAWNRGTDNQCSSGTDAACVADPLAIIKYEVYRKADVSTTSPFTTNPATDGAATKLTTISTTQTATGAMSYTDTSVRVAGTKYWYIVCMLDSSNNRTCDFSSAKSIVMPDVTPPTFNGVSPAMYIHGTSTPPVAQQTKIWDIAFEMADDTTSAANIKAFVYSKVTTSAAASAPSDYLNATLIAAGWSTIVDGNSEAWNGKSGLTNPVTVPSLKGPNDLNRYVNYAVVLQDATGNRTGATLSFYSQNAMGLTSLNGHATSAGSSTTKRNRGLKTNTNIVYIIGSGFTKSATSGGASTQVYFGDVTTGPTCTDVTIVDSTRLICKTPVTSLSGAQAVFVVNPDGSSASVSSLYTFDSIGVHICDTPGLWGANFAAGDGTSSGTAWQICDITQLDNIRRQATYGSGTVVYGAAGNKYFKLMDNIDLSQNVPLTSAIMLPLAGNYAAGTGTNAHGFSGYFDGNGLLLENWTYSTTNDAVGLFGSIYSCPGSCTVDNLTTYNFNLTGGTGVGTILGGPSNSTLSIYTYTNVYSFGGSVTAAVTAGGLVGSAAGAGISVMDQCGADVVVTSAGANAGGLAGSLVGRVTNSFARGDVTGANAVGGAVGALTPRTSGSAPFPVSVDAVTASGAVTVTGSGNAGGLFGIFSLTSLNGIVIQNSHATGGVVSTTATSASSLGGFIGALTCSSPGCNVTIAKSSSSGTISKTGAGVFLAAGGFIGTGPTQGTHLITQNHSAANVVGASTQAGGFIGVQSVSAGGTGSATCGIGTAQTCGVVYMDNYATGTATSSSECGGFIGSSNGSVTGGLNFVRNFAYGAPSCSTYQGGFHGRASSTAGADVYSGATVSYIDNRATPAAGTATASAHWNSQIAGATGVGLNGGSGTGAPVGATTTQMTGMGTLFSTAGYSISNTTVFPAGTTSGNTWKWPAATGAHPILDWQ
jgi:hypothetical protein